MLYWVVSTAELDPIKERKEQTSTSGSDNTCKQWHIKHACVILQIENVESSGSDNDEDFNKSTSTYSDEGRHLLTPETWSFDWHESTTCTKANTLDRKVWQKCISHKVSWDQVRLSTFNNQNSITYQYLNMMTNHYANLNLKTKQWCDLHDHSNEETASKVITFQMINPTVQD
jgi:hypothetical protein